MGQLSKDVLEEIKKRAEGYKADMTAFLRAIVKNPGESGAAGFGALAAIMLQDVKDLREKLQLNENSKVLCFNTEGDTDPERWKNIIWEAKEK